MRRASAIVLATTWLVGISNGFAQAPADSPAVVRNAARLAEAFERQEAGEGRGQRADADVLGTAYRALQDHLATSPNDMSALIVQARLARALTLLSPVVIEGGEVRRSSAAGPGDAIAALDQAIGVEPDNPEAHYWLARIYGLTTPGLSAGRISLAPLDLEQAIAHARRAVDLRPAEQSYRQALGMYLATARRYPDAIEVLVGDAAGVELLRLILEDFEAIPLPAEAKYLAHDSALQVESLTTNPRFATYTQFRARVYVAAGAKSVFETELREKWPTFELYEVQRTKADDGSETIAFVQALQENDGALQPAAERELARAMRTRSDPEGDVIVIVQEVADPSQETRQRLELADTDRLTLLTLMNQRTLD
jgi:tetratricopeptide (TPR) repeat protein